MNERPPIPYVQASTWVEVLVDERLPPTRLQLLVVHNYVIHRRLRDDVPVRLAPNGPWYPAREVIAACVEFQPTRAWSFVAIAAGLAALFAALQFMLGDEGASGSVQTVVLMAVVLAVALGRPSLRTRSALDLVRMRPPVLLVAAAASIVLPFSWSVYRALGHLHMKQRVELAFADPNPCGVRSVKQDVEGMGDQGWIKVYGERDTKCEQQIQLARCAELGAAIDSGVSAKIFSNDGATGSLAIRIATHAVTSSDLDTDRERLDCSDEVWPRLTSTFAHDPKAWVPQPYTTEGELDQFSVSPAMLSALRGRKLDAPIATMIHDRSETAAKAVAAKTKLEDTSRANAICKQVQDFELDVGPACAALMKRHGLVVAAANAKDAAQEKARSAADESRTAASLEAQKRGLFACTTQCNRARSDAQLATEAACREQCNGDISCSGACRKTSPCELRCMQQYPDATNDLATQMGL